MSSRSTPGENPPQIDSYYAGQADQFDTGTDIDGRIIKAGELFQTHQPLARTLLDVGCGAGSVGAYLGKLTNATEIFGVDISETRAQKARERGLQATVVDLNHSNLPFADGMFDAIFCGELIEHLIDPDHLLDEIGRTLGPSGVCVLTTPNLACWYNRVALLLGWQPFNTSVSFRYEVGRPRSLVGEYGCRDHIRVFTLPALQQLLQLHRFQILGVRGTRLSELWWGHSDSPSGHVKGLLTTLVDPLDRLLSTVPSLSTCVLVCFAKQR